MSIAVETGKQLVILLLLAGAVATVLWFYWLVAAYIATWGL